MKVLVIGREGQLARGLSERMNGSAIEVVATARRDVDLTSEKSVAAAVARERPGVVVNAAAYTAVDRAEGEPECAHAINALGAEFVARACAVHDIPIIHISTDYVFDGTKDGSYREDDATNPLNVYGRTKLEGEVRVAKTCRHHVILRTAWMHSPWGFNFVKTMLQLAATRSTIGVVDDQLGSPTYAVDLADIVLAIAARATSGVQGLEWGIYHAAGGGETTRFGFACEVFRRAAEQGLPTADVAAIATAQYPTPARRPANARLGCDKLRLRLGLDLPDWRLGVEACVARLAAGP